eukprot:1381237-Rhodomonas_salina.1
MGYKSSIKSCGHVLKQGKFSDKSYNVKCVFLAFVLHMMTGSSRKRKSDLPTMKGTRVSDWDEYE